MLDSIKKKSFCETSVKKSLQRISQITVDTKGGGGRDTPTGFRNGAASSSSRTPSNHGFISRCTAPARPFPECINGLGCKLYRPRGEIPVREPFRSVYRWICNSVVRTPLTLRTALRFNGKSRKTGGHRFQRGCQPIPFTLFSFHSSPLLLFFFFFDYSNRSFFLSRLYRAEAFWLERSFCLFLERGEEERDEKNISFSID